MIAYGDYDAVSVDFNKHINTKLATPRQGKVRPRQLCILFYLINTIFVTCKKNYLCLGSNRPTMQVQL
jgi:hypothetical protein